MPRTQHTPGPWQVTYGSNERGPEIAVWGPHVDFHGCREICATDGGCTASADDREIEANFQLIAAAPAMKAALLRVVRAGSHNEKLCALAEAKQALELAGAIERAIA